ncbi:MAG: LPS export ABC transporter periplasmic protein LptC [Hyphomicrobiales bacterium]|nr:LPS export ABC transporter periplasmic protein LptC [Hyphomicrobiales bacterium]
MDATSQHSLDQPVRPRWYTRPIVVMNWLALALTIGLLVTFLIQAGMLETIMESKQVSQPKDVTQEKVIVKASTVKGYDGEKQPYNIDAAAAAQDPDQPNIIGLDKVTGELRKASGQVFTIAADNGIYNSRTRTLDLKDNVVIVSRDRFVAKMPTARITLENKELFTDDHVVVTLKTGDITANGLRITDNGKNITFLNRVKAKLRQASAKENKQQ